MKKLHRSILLQECLDYLQVKPGGTYADLTFGEGGHTEAMLERGATKVVAIDRDVQALATYRAEGRLRDDPRLSLEHLRLSEFAAKYADARFDGILVDLGVSTRQLLEGGRGFSFAEAGPLDMRMDPSQEGVALGEVLDQMSADELADALYYNADLHESRSLARRILNAHQEGRLKTTGDLASLFGKKIPGKSHPATAPFLALRMLVNEEMFEVKTGIPPLLDRLVPGGRLAVISFHSSEDRAVKQIFQLAAGKCICREQMCRCPRAERVTLVNKKPVEASETELRDNPRSRSAKLRVVEKISHL